MDLRIGSHLQITTGWCGCKALTIPDCTAMVMFERLRDCDKWEVAPEGAEEKRKEWIEKIKHT